MGHDAWQPLDLDELAALMRGFPGPWWIAGGVALDLFLGRETRTHGDLDVALLRRDQRALHEQLRGWDARFATPERTLERWDGSPLELPVHAIWARRSEGAPWECEFLLNEADRDDWVFRREPSVTYPLVKLGRRARGLPILAPEVVLLYKAKEPAAADEADLAAALPHLGAAARRWLRRALEQAHPGHRWVEILATK